MFPQVGLISIELCGLAQWSSSVPSAQSAYGHRFDPRQGRFNANDKNKEENLVRFLLTNLATRRLGGFGFAKTLESRCTENIIPLDSYFCNIEADVTRTVNSYHMLFTTLREITW